MRAGGSKSKGSAFEREVCTFLSLWMSRSTRKDLFWRSAMSGGRATVQKRGLANKTQAGDISAIDPQGDRLTRHVCIECKHYKNLHLEQLYVQTVYTSDGLSKFWRKQVASSTKIGKSPMVVCRQNAFAAGMLVCLNNDGRKRFSLHTDAHIAHFPLHDLYIYTAESFRENAARPV